MILCGGLVNPVQKGLSVIEDEPLLESVRQIDEADNGLWVVEGLDYPYNNLTLLSGVATVRSTNVYPNLERWQILDPDREYTDVYNRYAHIFTYLGQEDADKFELIRPDCFRWNATIQDYADLGIKYIVSLNELESYSTDQISVTKIFSEGESTADFKVYEIQTMD